MIKMKLEFNEVFTIAKYTKEKNRPQNLLIQNLMSNSQLMIV
jgi:hypothetical protein